MCKFLLEVSGLVLWLGAGSLCAADPSTTAVLAVHPNLEFQYESEGIRIPRASSDEPRVQEFGPESVAAALSYLEGGSLAWVRERGCVNCHTTGPYLSERSALTELFGVPSKEVRENFAADVPQEIKPGRHVDKSGHKYINRSYYVVWRSLGLAEWDKHVSKKLSGETERSLRDMFAHQSESGAFVTYGEVEVPHVTTDFELTLQAARAVSAAPNWLSSVKDPELLERVERMKGFLVSAKPKNDFDRVLKLQLFHYLPELSDAKEKTAALQLLTSKQHDDGGWSVRDMSALEDWHYVISPKVRSVVEGLPDAAQPKSDPYMTALALVLMRQSGVPASDVRILAGVSWLQREQRVSGRWWMHSLYRGNYNYITYIATCQALKALQLCGALEPLEP